MRDARRDAWPRVRDAFHEALERPPADRLSFVERRLAGDDDALEEVRELLESHAAADGFLDPDDVAAPPDGARIGPYRCIAELGRGGMGTVSLAVRDDGEFRQRVAVKVLKRGLDTDEIVRRFRAERQTLAALEHPSIARVLDGGTTDDGRPYLVMEAIDGEPIDAYCEARSLPRRARLELFLEVARAVGHAHQLLIVHRDLKPANVLVTETGGVPTPKLLDFGLAKLLSADGTADDVTAAFGAGAWLTPAYASPEQIRGDAIGTATDVYSLGALLHCMLTGAPPFEIEGSGPAAIARSVEARVVPPLDGGRGRTDLDTILRAALAPDPARRYPSVERFADDVRRLLDGLPVAARPSTFAYRARKFLRRNAVPVASLSVAFVLLVAAVATLLGQAREIRAEAAARRDAIEFLGRVLTSVDPVNEGRDVDFLRVVEEAVPAVDREFADRPLERALLQDQLGRTFHRLGRYDEARRLLEAALAARRAHAEADAAEIAESLDHLADLLLDVEAFDDARPLLLESLDRRRTLDDPVALAATHNLVGLWHYWTNDLDEAERHLRRALALQREHLGETSEAASLSLNNLALVNQERGDDDAAIECLERSVEIQRALFDRPHPSLATGLYNLGWLSHHRRRTDRARIVLEEAVAIRRELFGARHLDTALAVGTLGNVLLDLGDHVRSEPLLREAHRVIGDLVSRESYHFANASFGLGKLYEATGRPSAAADAYEQAHSVYRRRGPASHDASLSATRAIVCRVEAGEHDVARESIAAFLAAADEETVWVRGHVGEVLTARARRLRAEGETAAAEEALAAALSIPKAVWSWRRVWTLELKSECDLERGAFEAATAALEEALATLDRDLPGAAVVRSRLRHALGRVAWAAGDRAAAEPLLREAGDALTRSLRPDHPWLDVVDAWRARLDDA